VNVIVFGGSGFLGSHVADTLSDAEHNVIIYDLKESSCLNAGQEMIVGDLLDEDAVMAAVKGRDVVYNFAGIADIEEASYKPVKTIPIWVK
jgi:UDP-glucose 4-epimerase